MMKYNNVINVITIYVILRQQQNDTIEIVYICATRIQIINHNLIVYSHYLYIFSNLLKLLIHFLCFIEQFIFNILHIS